MFFYNRQNGRKIRMNIAFFYDPSFYLGFPYFFVKRWWEKFDVLASKCIKSDNFYVKWNKNQHLFPGTKYYKFEPISPDLVILDHYGGQLEAT